MANYSNINSLADLVALPNSQAYLDQFDDSVRGEQLNYGGPTKKYNYNEVQQAADAIRASGQELQQGNKFYDTGNPAVNEALYGADIANNLGTDGTTGFRTPRQYDTDIGDYIAAGLKTGIEGAIRTAVTGGGGLFGSLGQIAEGGLASVNLGQVVRQGTEFVNDIKDDAEQEAPDIAWQLPDVTDVLGDVQVQVPDFQLPNEGGGGGGEESEAQTSDPVLSDGGGQDIPELGEQIDPNHAERDDGQWIHQNPDGTWVAGNEMGEVWEIPAPNEGENDLVLGGLGDLTQGNVSEVIDPTWEPSVSVTQGESSTPGVNLPGAGNAVTGNVLQGGDLSNGGSNGTGSGTSGNGTGANGTGNGNNGDGNGEGSGSDTPISDSLFASESEFGDLFPYTAINPVRAANLGGLMDYVAALRGGIR